MKKSFLSLCLCILALAGCKKESTDLNSHVVSIIILPVESDGVSSAGYNYKLKAMIISPAGLEVEDHGFLVSGASSTNGIIPVSLGSAKIAGGIESDFPSALPEGQFSVAAYAVLKTGETIYSEGYTPPTPPTATKVEIGSPGYSTAYSGYETFTGDVFNNDVSMYQITEMGIEYATLSDFSSNGGNYTNYYVDPYAGTQASVVPFFLQISTGTIFLKSTSYQYRTYVTIMDIKTTNTFKVTDNTYGTLTFTGQ